MCNKCNFFTSKNGQDRLGQGTRVTRHRQSPGVQTEAIYIFEMLISQFYPLHEVPVGRAIVWFLIFRAPLVLIPVAVLLKIYRVTTINKIIRWRDCDKRLGNLLN